MALPVWRCFLRGEKIMTYIHSFRGVTIVSLIIISIVRCMNWWRHSSNFSQYVSQLVVWRIAELSTIRSVFSQWLVNMSNASNERLDVSVSFWQFNSVVWLRIPVGLTGAYKTWKSFFICFLFDRGKVVFHGSVTGISLCTWSRASTWPTEL